MVTEVLTDSVVENLGPLIKTLQALGGILLFYIFFGIVNMILNNKKSKEMKKMNRNLEEIKIILKKKK